METPEARNAFIDGAGTAGATPKINFYPSRENGKVPSVPNFSLPEVCPPQLQPGSTASSTHTSSGLDPSWASSLLDFALPQALK